MVTIEITQEAADCLLYWIEHPMYGGNFSDVIVLNMKEWMCREQAHHGLATMTDVSGLFQKLKSQVDIRGEAK